MFWETVAALFLIIVSFPLRMFVAIIWGVIRFALGLLATLLALTSIEQIWLVPVVAVVEGFQAAWSVPATIWNWVKFEHPWWAVIIGVVVLIVQSGGARGR